MIIAASQVGAQVKTSRITQLTALDGKSPGLLYTKRLHTLNGTHMHISTGTPPSVCHTPVNQPAFPFPTPKGP